MTRPDESEAEQTSGDTTTADTKSRFAWTSRIPAHLPGGLRTTTVGLVIVFLLVLLLWNAVRYDPTKNQNSPVYVPPAPTTTEEVPTQQYTPTREPSATTTPSATPSVTTTPEPGSEQGGATTAPDTATTTTTPGFRLPTIPGLQLPGLTPPTTTTPTR